MKKKCLSLKSKYYVMFNIRSKRPDFVLKTLKVVLNPFVDRLSLQQLEYKMERADDPDDYNFS